ncbi:hypothetical protein ACHAW6_010828 [Cyclotella cf. meneghiniana]
MSYMEPRATQKAVKHRPSHSKRNYCMLPQRISCPELPPDNHIWMDQGKIEEKPCYMCPCHPSYCRCFTVCLYWSLILQQCQDGGQRFQSFLQSLQ